jgi:hypothetical protein
MQVLRQHINLAKTVSTNADYGEFSVGNVLNIGYVGELTASAVSPGNIANSIAPNAQKQIAVTLNRLTFLSTI